MKHSLKKILLILIVFASLFLQYAISQVNIPAVNEKNEYGWVLKFEDNNGEWDWKDKPEYDGSKLLLWFERKDRGTLSKEKFLWEIVNLQTGKREGWEQECKASDKSIYDHFALRTGKYI
jgi:hypothetical protein